MHIVERIKTAASRRGYTLAEIEQNLGFGVRTIYKWDKNSPSVEKVLSVANFLGVSMTWLVTGSEAEQELPVSFLSRYRELSEEEKEKIEHFIDVCSCRPPEACADAAAHSRLPILGRASSDMPTEGVELLGYAEADVPADFVLIMGDSSMNPLIVPEGYIFVRKDDPLTNGDIGIFLCNHQIICRQYLSAADTVILRPINPQFQEISYKTHDFKQIRQVGKAVFIHPDVAQQFNFMV